jgi:hypothetical protein
MSYQTYEDPEDTAGEYEAVNDEAFESIERDFREARYRELD